MPGLVIIDHGDGDAHVCVVDDALWDQVVEVTNAGEISDKTYNELLWLAYGTHRPEGAPDRKGSVVTSCFTKTWAVEVVDIPALRGILTLPHR